MMTFADYTESTEFPGIFTRVLKEGDGLNVVAILEVRRGSDGFNFGAIYADHLASDMAIILADPPPQGPFSLKEQVDSFAATVAPDGTDATDVDEANKAVATVDNSQSTQVYNADTPASTGDAALADPAPEEATRRERPARA